MSFFFLSFVILVNSNVRHWFLSTVLSPWVFGVYLLLMGALVWVPPGVPPQPVQIAGSCRGPSEGYSGVKLLWRIHSPPVRSGQTLRQTPVSLTTQPLMGQAAPVPPSLLQRPIKAHRRMLTKMNGVFFLCSFCTNQSFSFVMALRQPFHRQAPLGPDNV